MYTFYEIFINCPFYRFVSVHNLDKTSSVEDAVLLALAAEEFLLEPLQIFCRSEIERMLTEENMWPTLNSIIHIPKIASACSKVIIIFRYKISSSHSKLLVSLF